MKTEDDIYCLQIGERYEEYLRKIGSIIPAVSMGINFPREARNKIELRFFEIKELTDADKSNVLRCIESAKWNYSDGGTTPFAIIPGGWHLLPLRKYVEELGYKYGACGNVFDLLIHITNQS